MKTIEISFSCEVCSNPITIDTNLNAHSHGDTIVAAYIVHPCETCQPKPEPLDFGKVIAFLRGIEKKDRITPN